jgi:poly(A) polymerase
MIRRFISKVFGRGKDAKHAPHESRPVVWGPGKHHIAKDGISRGARKTCEELQRAGRRSWSAGP